MIYIALYEGAFGEGSTIEEAYMDLKDSYSSDIDIDDITFIKGKEVKVKIVFEEVKRMEEHVIEDRGSDLGLDMRESLIARQMNANRKKQW